MTGDVEIAEPGPGQVRVRHCGVCHSDLHIAPTARCPGLRAARGLRTVLAC